MFTLFDGLIELPFYTCCSPHNCVTLTRNVCVPAYSEALIQVDIPTRFNNQDVLLEQTPRALSVTVAKALATCKNNKAFCKVLNMHPYMVTLKKGLKIAKAAGLVDSVAAMQPCHPPAVNNTIHHLLLITLFTTMVISILALHTLITIVDNDPIRSLTIMSIALT